jgi:hypothetical protein
VSAPLGLCRMKTERVGRPKPWIENPKRHPTKTDHPLGPNHGWRGGGPPCPLRWMLIRRHPTNWAAKNPESKTPKRPPSTRRAERVRKRRGGGADLRVRSAGPGSDRNRPHGLPNRLDRKHPVHPAENHRTTNSHNHPPKPFPEGEIFHSPGLPRSGYPGWGTSIMTVEPQRGSLDAGCDWNSGSIGPRTPETGHNPPHGLS